MTYPGQPLKIRESITIVLQSVDVRALFTGKVDYANLFECILLEHSTRTKSSATTGERTILQDPETLHTI